MVDAQETGAIQRALPRCAAPMEEERPEERSEKRPEQRSEQRREQRREHFTPAKTGAGVEVGQEAAEGDGDGPGARAEGTAAVSDEGARMEAGAIVSDVELTELQLRAPSGFKADELRCMLAQVRSEGCSAAVPAHRHAHCPY